MSRSMTKPTKWPVRPAKTQISLGICPVWSVFAVRMKKYWDLSYPLIAEQWLRSDPPRLTWAFAGRTSFCWFCHAAAQIWDMLHKVLGLHCVSVPYFEIQYWNTIMTYIVYTIMILSFQTDMPGQTVQTQIRLLEEQSDQGLHCLPFRLHRLDSLLYGRAT